MNTEMTVYGISAKDTMIVSNRLNGVNDEQQQQPQPLPQQQQSDSSINNNILNDSNWGPNSNTSNSSGNDVNDSFSNADESLEPIERLEKYSSSEIIFHRQVVARSVLETLNDVQQSDVQRVMCVISRLASDTEPSIRAELVEQLPHISAYCVNQIVNLPNLVPHYILPILEQFLTDSNSQVRKMTQNAFVLMLEQGLIKNDFLENQICPLLIQLTDFSNLDDYRMEAVGMMSKIVRFMGRELTEKLLLNSFSRLCSDVSFHVRRVCAAHFGDFCTVVGQDITENILLAHFRRLCKDSIWGVRKSCADVFVPISLVVSNKVRHEILSPVFVSLLCDGSRWVKTAAFQTLGPFISTFADSSKTGLYYSDNGTVVIEDHASNDSGFSAGSESNIESPTEIDDDIEEVSLLQHNFDDLALNSISQQKNSAVNIEEIVSKDQFSQFLYWKIPITELSFDDDVNQEFSVSENLVHKIEQMMESSSSNNIEVSRSEDIFISDECKDIKFHELGNDYENKDIEMSDNNANSVSTNLHEMSLTYIEKEFDVKKSKINLVSLNDNIINCSPQVNPLTYISNSMSIQEPLLTLYSNKSESDEFMSLEELKTMPFGYNNAFQYRRPSYTQDIIPNDLLEHYLSMTNPIHYQTIDPDLSHHCAYSLPAVALTLGRQNWCCLRETYELLAAEMQWKVRWTLASSLHQMSLILGTDLTTRDLLPIFLSFMKDLDEVRFGILQNLAQFLKLLLRTQQQGILPKISEFLKMDNNRNWRFRYTLAEQLIEISNLYTPNEIKEYLLPIGLVLLVDKVSEVRLIAISVISVFIKLIFESQSNSMECNNNVMDIIHELNAHFANSSKWIHRKTFIILCEKLIEDNALPYPLYIDTMLDHLLNMSTDNVPNIRLVLARCVVRTLWPIAQFRSHLRVQQTLEDLQQDNDGDVRILSMLTGNVSESTNIG